jgi:hypothetical protein
MSTISPLRRRMIEDMTIRNLSLATQQSYIYAIANSARARKSYRRDRTVWLGWEDSNSGIRSQAMCLRSRNNSRRLRRNLPPETIRV